MQAMPGLCHCSAQSCHLTGCLLRMRAERPRILSPGDRADGVERVARRRADTREFLAHGLRLFFLSCNIRLHGIGAVVPARQALNLPIETPV